MKSPVLAVLIFGFGALALTSCSSDRSIGSTAVPVYGIVHCPKASEGRGSITLAPGTVLKSTNLCVEARSAKYEGKLAKIIWGNTSPIGPVSAELTKDASGKVSLMYTGGRHGTQATLQQGSERIPFNFTINGLQASGAAASQIDTSTNLVGSITVPPLRGLGYTDSRGRGAEAGYDQSTAFYAYSPEAAVKGTAESRARESGEGQVTFQVKNINAEKGEISGTFISKQPSGVEGKGEVEVEGYFIGNFK
ncbi:MAG: photosystem II manganese-stabilizing polypeptide [Gloeobacterales cyanobacterium]